MLLILAVFICAGEIENNCDTLKNPDTFDLCTTTNFLTYLPYLDCLRVVYT